MTAGKEVIQRKGATFYAVSLSVARIIEAILHNEKSVLTVSTYIERFGPIADVCLSLPAVVGSEGIREVLPIAAGSRGAAEAGSQRGRPEGDHRPARDSDRRASRSATISTTEDTKDTEALTPRAPTRRGPRPGAPASERARTRGVSGRARARPAPHCLPPGPPRGGPASKPTRAAITPTRAIRPFSVLSVPSVVARRGRDRCGTSPRSRTCGAPPRTDILAPFCARTGIIRRRTDS